MWGWIYWGLTPAEELSHDLLILKTFDFQEFVLSRLYRMSISILCFCLWTLKQPEFLWWWHKRVHIHANTTRCAVCLELMAAQTLTYWILHTDTATITNHAFACNHFSNFNQHNVNPLLFSPLSHPPDWSLQMDGDTLLLPILPSNLFTARL